MGKKTHQNFLPFLLYFSPNSEEMEPLSNLLGLFLNDSRFAQEDPAFLQRRLFLIFLGGGIECHLFLFIGDF